MEVRCATGSLLRNLSMHVSALRPLPFSFESLRAPGIRQCLQRPKVHRSLVTSSRRSLQATLSSDQQVTAEKEEEAPQTQLSPQQRNQRPETAFRNAPPGRSGFNRRPERPIRREDPNADLNSLLNARVGNFGQASPRHQTTSQPRRGVPIEKMNIPTSSNTTQNTPQSYNINGFLESRRAPVIPDTRPAPFHISAALGRTVDVRPKNQDLARAFRQLEIRCSQNSVKRDLAYQRFHERPGLKRKRLHRERWRKRFKADFQATVRRVEELRRKGW